MRVAVLSDVHGNLLALEAVLKDVRAQGADLVVNLGDVLSGPLEPAATADLLVPLAFPTVSGNHERQLLACEHEQGAASDRFAFDRATAAHREWLRGFPATLELEGGVLACHGTPGSDRTYLLEEVVGRGVRPASDAAVESHLAGLPHRLVLCGHSHLPARRLLPGGRLVVNPGSVGLQAFDDDRPGAHAVENGSPHARYALCDVGPSGCRVTFRAIDYDHHAASAQALRNGRQEWARWLATGRV